MLFEWFGAENDIPFFIQYGSHETNMYLHSHEDFCEIVTVLSGRAVHVTGGGRFSVKKGDLFVMKPGTIHAYEQPEEFNICNIMLTEKSFLECERQFSDIAGFKRLFCEPYEESGGLWLSPELLSEAQRLISLMMLEYGSNREGREPMLRSLFSQFVIFLSRHYGVPLKRYEKAAIENAAIYLQEHFTEDDAARSAAKLSNYSSRHFERLFSDVYGITPNRYLAEVRLGRARTMLITTDEPISLIARRCGFGDPSYFTKLFRERFGEAPKAYRMSK